MRRRNYVPRAPGLTDGRVNAIGSRWHLDLKIRQMQFRPWKSSAKWRVQFVIDEKQRTVTVLQVRHERRRQLFEVEDK